MRKLKASYEHHKTSSNSTPAKGVSTVKGYGSKGGKGGKGGKANGKRGGYSMHPKGDGGKTKGSAARGLEMYTGKGMYARPTSFVPVAGLPTLEVDDTLEAQLSKFQPNCYKLRGTIIGPTAVCNYPRKKPKQGTKPVTLADVKVGGILFTNGRVLQVHQKPFKQYIFRIAVCQLYDYSYVQCSCCTIASLSFLRFSILRCSITNSTG